MIYFSISCLVEFDTLWVKSPKITNRQCAVSVFSLFNGYQHTRFLCCLFIFHYLDDISHISTPFAGLFALFHVHVTDVSWTFTQFQLLLITQNHHTMDKGHPFADLKMRYAPKSWVYKYHRTIHHTPICQVNKNQWFTLDFLLKSLSLQQFTCLLVVKSLQEGPLVVTCWLVYVPQYTVYSLQYTYTYTEYIYIYIYISQKT